MQDFNQILKATQFFTTFNILLKLQTNFKPPSKSSKTCQINCLPVSPPSSLPLIWLIHHLKSYISHHLCISLFHLACPKSKSVFISLSLSLSVSLSTISYIPCPYPHILPFVFEPSWNVDPQVVTKEENQYTFDSSLIMRNVTVEDAGKYKVTAR